MKKYSERAKYLITGLVIGILISSGIVFAASEYILTLFEAKIVVNGEEREGSNRPFQYYNGQYYVPTSLIYNGTTYVPLKFFAETFGQPVKYDSSTKTIYIGKESDEDRISRFMSDFMEPSFLGESTYYCVNGEMTMRGKKYTKGYQFFNNSGESHMSFNLEGKYTNIQGIVGLEDDNKTDTTVEFYGDDKLITTLELEVGHFPKNINIDVTGVIKFDVKCKPNKGSNTGYIDLSDFKIK